ncbi:MAG: hypothetical protein U1E73_11675 [Planctomycetota bacterium]
MMLTNSILHASSFQFEGGRGGPLGSGVPFALEFHADPFSLVGIAVATGAWKQQHPLFRQLQLPTDAFGSAGLVGADATGLAQPTWKHPGGAGPARFDAVVPGRDRHVVALAAQSGSRRRRSLTGAAAFDVCADHFLPRHRRSP